MKKIKSVAVAGLLALGLAGFPDQAYANCNCGPAVWQIPPAIDRTTTAVTGVDTTLKTEIKTAIINSVAKQTGAQQAMFDGLFEKLKAAMLDMEAAKASTASKRRLSSHAFNHCSNRDVASAAASGMAASNKLRETLNLVMKEEGEGTKKSEEEARNGVRKVVMEGPLKDKPSVGHDIFPADNLLDEEEVRRARDTISLIADPYPNPKVTEEKTLSRVQALTEQRIKQARLAISEDTLNGLLSDGAATLPADLLEEYVKTAKADPALAEVHKDANGKTSVAEYYDILGRKARALNPNWYQYLMDEVSDEIGVLREIAQMQAMELSIAVETRDLLKRIAGLLAVQTAIKTQETSNGRINGAMFAPGIAPVAGGGAE